MRAGFDAKHQMRVIQLETAIELEVCAEAARKVETLPEISDEVYSTAGFVIALSVNSNVTPEVGALPLFCGKDADGLIHTLDLGSRNTENEAQRMVTRSLLRQVQAQGIDVAAVLAA